MITPDPQDPIFQCWTAAWLDTEGSISITAHAHRHYRSPTYSARLGVTQTVRAPLDLLHDAWGGNIQSREVPPYQRSYQWYLTTHAKVRALLVTVRPYLVVKAQQADTALALLDALTAHRLTGSRLRTTDLEQLLADIKEHMHLLNGRSPEQRQRMRDGFRAEKPRGFTPLPFDRWAQEYDACIACGRSDGRHAGKGRCRACYAKAWRARREQCVICGRSDVTYAARGVCGTCYNRDVRPTLASAAQ
jgi:hypothetical protein